MKQMLTGLYLVLGTLCLFGLPSAILGLSALFSDEMLKLLHSSLSAVNSVGFQLEVLVIVFGASAGGLATAMALFAGLWFAIRALRRASEPEPGLAPAAAREPRVIAPEVEAVSVGHIDHSGAHRRGRARVA